MAYIPRFPESAFVVGPITKAGYQTIQSAIDAANSLGGGQVFIQPGNYAENLTLYSNVSLVGAAANAAIVQITGVHTPPASGTVAFEKISFISASDVFSSVAAGTTTIILSDCLTQAAAGYTFNLLNWAGIIECTTVSFNGASDGITNNTGGAALYFTNCDGGTSGATLTCSGGVLAKSSIFRCAVNITASSIDFDTCRFTRNVTADGSSSGSFINCNFQTGSVQSFTMSSSSGVKLQDCIINTSNNPAIGGSGAGTLTIESVVFENNALIAGTVTTGSGSGMILGDFGTATHVLTSNGPGVAPSWQVVSSSGAVMDIDGNTGTATPSSGTITLTTGAANAQGTAVFTASGSTVTQTFSDASANLGLGANSLNSLAGGLANTCYGVDAGTALSSGSSATFIGYKAGEDETTGTGSTAVGFSALQNANATLSANDAFGANVLSALTSGSGGNVGVGNSSLQQIATGSFNCAIGNFSGRNLTLANSSNICINHGGVVGDNNTLRIGAATGSGQQQLTKAFICGIDGVNVGSVAKVVTMASDQLGTATITAGTGVSIGTSANTITVNATGGGVAWSVISADQTAAVNNGYFCNKAGLLSLALPATSAVGDVIEASNINTAVGLRITQAAGQQIFIGNTNTTLGAGGYIESLALGDSVKLVCRVANTTWQTVSMMGNFTVV